MNRVCNFLAVLITAMLFPGCATSGAGGAGHARIHSLNGTCEIRRTGGNWEPAHLWERLGPGDQARTRGDGKIDFSLGRYGGVLTLMPESLIAFEQIGPLSRGDRVVAMIDLQEGRVVGETLKLPANTHLQVKTRDGVHEIP